MMMYLISVFILCLSSITSAQSFVGTFVAVKGDVKVLKSSNGSAAGPFVRYEGKKYIYEAAKIGNKVKPADVIQSGTDGKAKIAYPNGDNFVIGNGTSLVLPSISEKSDGTKKNSSLELIYGKVRALISKSGPRNNMTVKTPSAVAGVRGTDFFTRSNPSDGTQITVLRGQVSMQTISKPDDIVQIKTGFTADSNLKAAENLKPIETTREELVTLQSESTVKVKTEELAALSPEIKNDIDALNTKTTQAVLVDIKSHDEELYKKLADNGKMDSDSINTLVVSNLYKQAPTSKIKKPTAEEINAIGSDIYKKYFGE
jgi:hypothetical protein